MDILASIDRWARLAPKRLAHISGEHALSYAELKCGSDALASYLVRRWPGDRSPVAVRGHKEPEMLIAFLGAVKAGHPYVPIDVSVPEQRAERIVSSAGAIITLTPGMVAEHRQEPVKTALPSTSASDPYYIMFTSGSTGEPKGVVILTECLSSFVEWMLAEHKFPEQQEIFLNQAPFSFDLSVMDLYLSLVSGGTLFSLTADQIANPRRLYQALASSGITTWVSTPSFAQLCLAERSFNQQMLPCLRRFLFCGETLPSPLAAQLLDRFPSAAVWNTYGPTEATVATTSIQVDRDILARYSPLPVGYAKPGTRIVIMDQAQQPVAEGERGEIVIAGANVSPGYLGRADLTQRSFFTLNGLRAYRTGDAGRCQDNLLFFEGRIDAQVKLHGYRIELGDIEANLQALPGVRQAVVVPVLKDAQVQSLTAYVIYAERPVGTDFELSSQLKQKLLKRVPAYMVPYKFRFVESLPMTANGKADRRQLAELVA